MLVNSLSVFAGPNGMYHMNGNSFKIARDLTDRTPSEFLTATARNGFNSVFENYPKLISPIISRAILLKYSLTAMFLPSLLPLTRSCQI